MYVFNHTFYRFLACFNQLIRFFFVIFYVHFSILQRCNHLQCKFIGADRVKVLHVYNAGIVYDTFQRHPLRLNSFTLSFFHWTNLIFLKIGHSHLRLNLMVLKDFRCVCQVDSHLFNRELYREILQFVYLFCNSNLHQLLFWILFNICFSN